MSNLQALINLILLLPLSYFWFKDMCSNEPFNTCELDNALKKVKHKHETK